MIRRRLSTGALRALAFPTTAATTAAAVPITPSSFTTLTASTTRSQTFTQTQGLASAVLLSSQRNWKQETVQTIKAELKRRGLSQSGNKATLISRIQSADATAMLPPLPPHPTPSSTKTPTRTRALSTSSISRASTPSAPDSASANAPTAPTSGAESVASTGPAISTPRTEAPKVQPIQPEQLTVAPGLPKTKDAKTAAPSAEKLDIKLPMPAAEAPRADQVIPFTPDNFSSKQSTSSIESEPDTVSTAPKVMTVASAATHPAGGPVHGVHEPSDSHSHELDTSSSDSTASSSNPSVGSLLNRIFVSAPAAAWNSTGLEVPTVGMPQGKVSEDYKATSKPLNDEERRGVWILAGIVATALVLGGPRKEKKKGKASEEGQGHGEVVGSHGIKGDAQWEKASGAGVVGHGSRKE